MKYLAGYLACCLVPGMADGQAPDHAGDYPDEVYALNAISNRNRLSAASKRALARNYYQGPEWFCGFRKHDLRGDFLLVPDPSLTHVLLELRDPFFMDLLEEGVDAL